MQLSHVRWARWSAFRGALFVFTLATFALPARAVDLVVDGTTVTIAGDQVYDAVQVINGGQLQVTDYDGNAATSGKLTIEADSIYVDATSAIIANAAGYRGLHNANGEGPGGGQGGACCRDAGGGGAHGGDGGDASRDGCTGTDGAGGTAYGDAASLDADMGSAGGAAGHADGDDGGYGADGGGAIVLDAPSIVIEGNVYANGANGALYNNDAAGGGAGGGIVLIADELTCTGTLFAYGGNGAVVDDGGGGGGGGVVKQFYDSPSTTCSALVAGGTAGCGADAGATGIDASDEIDWDGDGYTYADGDCDTQDATIYPGADEYCDGVDNDCDGLIDEGDAVDADTWYRDLDGDGFGDAGDSTTACDQPQGYVEDATDCDDGDAFVYPGADEYCNGYDDDCDGVIDEDDAVDVQTWYRDLDGDGFGDAGDATVDCDQPAGYVSDATDCNDNNPNHYPGATEWCNGEDDDCDGVIDEDDAADAQTWYADDDGDGFGDPQVTDVACDQPEGYVEDNTDCDDGDAAVYPGADEYCNGYDDDCDGAIDEDDAVDAQTWYADDDGDGFGDPGDAMVDCDQPQGYVADDSDCDDGDAAVYPGADEYCNGHDDDCDGLVDEDDAIDVQTWYADDDGDGFGDAGSPDVDCDQPQGYVADATDCDDADAAVYPGADEYCNGYDDDCDGVIDEDDAIDVQTWYADDDGDGFGDAGSPDVDCDQPQGYVADATDCDDADAAVYPGAPEYCNGLDDDCDGVIDEDDAVDVQTWYADNDGDGFGDAGNPDIDCNQPSGYVADSTDCDDGNAAVYPGATEVCNGLDDDCDGTVDEDDAVDAQTWYADNDGDGFGDAGSPDVDCDQPQGYVADSTDCDDGNAAVFPGATELCNGIDDDCDGLVDEDDAADAATWHLDLDGDGFGHPNVTWQACDQPEGWVADSTDCDDNDAAVFPGATELCNGIDDDCDGLVDEDDAADVQTWYADADGDGFGDPGATDVDCAQPQGYVADSTDCDDNDAAQFPGATEYCNGEDDDCDGEVDEDDAADAATWYADADGDGYGDPGTTEVACDAPEGYVADSTDCDDADAAVYPGAEELCNGIDDDCDGAIDEDDAADAATWYEDADGDGFGNPQVDAMACDAPPGYVEDDTDCDDADAMVFPGADEYCNGIDDDCDGDVDEDDALDVTEWFLDADGDGFGDPQTSVMACDAPQGYVEDDNDCDDADAMVFPGADEYCNGVDDDCDGEVDEDDALDALTWYADADGDGFGDAAVTAVACEPPAGFVEDDSDCDDADAMVFPGADEYCNGIDDDCDGDVDEDDAVDALTWYLDDDGDGFGDPALVTHACEPPQGYVEDGTDCDDAAPAVNPDADEICNGVDDDCDALTDELVDGDGDGYSICDGDCDDTDVDVNPDADEICDGIDNDCNPFTDEEVDGDGDGWSICDGDCDDDEPAMYPNHVELCDGLDNDCDGMIPAVEADDDGDGQLVCDGDCDDADPTIYDGAPELCDQIDNDCDGDVDEDVDVDLDGDGFNACQGDCNNNEPTVYPGAPELCDGFDNDCDGDLPLDELDEDGDGWRVCDGDCDDDDASLELDDDDGDGWTTCDDDCDDNDASLNHDDVDGDGFSTCDLDCDDDDDTLDPFDADLDGFSTCDDDCDDDDATAYPGAPEIAYDGIDQDCDGLDLADVDGDGYDGGTVGDDCDDEDADVNPGATELCDDEIDNDCDGLVDYDDVDDCEETGDDDDSTGDDDDDDDATSDDDTTGDDDDEGRDCSCENNQGATTPISPIASLAALLGLVLLRRRRA